MCLGGQIEGVQRVGGGVNVHTCIYYYEKIFKSLGGQTEYIQCIYMYMYYEIIFQNLGGKPRVYMNIYVYIYTYVLRYNFSKSRGQTEG